MLPAVPTGFTTYTPNNSNTGSGSNVQGHSSLTVTMAATAATGTFQFRCIATYSKCAASPVTSNTISFTVNAKPVVSFTAQPGAAACANTNVTYTTQAGQSGYSWVIPGISGTDYTIVSGGTTTSSTVTLKWLKGATQTVTINYSNSTNCTAATPTSSTPTVVNLVAPTFSAQPSGPVCSNTDVTYTTQSGKSFYTWLYSGTLNVDYSITSGGSSTDNTVTLKWLTASVARTVSVNYTSVGCTAAAATASTSIVVNARPLPTFTSSAGANTCVSTPVIYTTQAGQLSYTWSVPGSAGTDYTITSGGLGTGSNTVTLKWITTGTKVVTVNYTSGTCGGIAAASSSTTVNALPVITFTSSPGINTCPNLNTTYTTQPGQSNYLWTVEGTAGIDYSITAGGVGTGSNTVTLQWLTTGSNRTVTVNYANANMCTATTTASSTTFIGARPAPVYSTAPDPTTCASTDVIYTTQAAQSAYVWNVPGTAGIDYIISSGGIAASNNSVTLQWITAGSKTVTVNYNNTNGCNSLTPASSTTTVNIPVIPIVTPGSSTTFCAGGSVTLTSSAASGYQWYFDGSSIPGATLNTYSANASGSYVVKILNATGCNATSVGTDVIANPLPAINTSASASSSCFSTGSHATSLSYSDVDNSPVSYSIGWNAAAVSAGFSTVTNAVLPSSPISIVIPPGAPANTYTGSITVTNSAGCISSPKTFSLSIIAPPDVSNFSIAAASGCEGTGATITIISSTLVNGNYTVYYDLTGANNGSGVNAPVAFIGGSGTFIAAALNPGATDIIITEIALVGCNTLPASGNTASFTVNTFPAVAVTSGPAKVCIGNTIALSNSTGGGTWSTSDAGIATVDNNGIVTGISAGIVDIIYTTTANASNCTNSAIKNIAINGHFWQA
ncbi:MAG: hypothetical protein WKI04_04870 [Ferruginibacter sp.]